jgi:hypothetical protein
VISINSPGRQNQDTDDDRPGEKEEDIKGLDIFPVGDPEKRPAEEDQTYDEEQQLELGSCQYIKHPLHGGFPIKAQGYRSALVFLLGTLNFLVPGGRGLASFSIIDPKLRLVIYRTGKARPGD